MRRILGNCLIGRNKEREEKFPQPHLPCYSAPTHEDRWCFHLCQRSLKFRSKSNERSISVSSHRNIWDYLRSDVYRNLPFRFWQTGSLPCFSHVKNSEKEFKLWDSDSLWLARFDWKFLGYSHIWSIPHKRHIRALCPFLDFLAGIFWGSQTAHSGQTGRACAVPPKTFA